MPALPIRPQAGRTTTRRAPVFTIPTQSSYSGGGGSRQTEPSRRERRRRERLLLAVADLRSHPPLFAAELPPTFAGSLCAQVSLPRSLRVRDRVAARRAGEHISISPDPGGRQGCAFVLLNSIILVKQTAIQVRCRVRCISTDVEKHSRFVLSSAGTARAFR